MAKGKALYQPNGKAAEYNRWAVNFYTGCSHDCEYCYCKRGVLAHVWDTKPHLKKCFKDEKDALEAFKKELLANRLRVRAEGGVFFSFSTDPCLKETFALTRRAMLFCLDCDVPVTILTKNVNWIEWLDGVRGEKKLFGDKDDRNPALFTVHKGRLAIGFTLTGHDELEPNASPSDSRIGAMYILKAQNIRTFASIEPIIDTEASLKVIEQAAPNCDLFKIGLRSGVPKDYYKGQDFKAFMEKATEIVGKHEGKIYWKDSIRTKLFAAPFLKSPVSVGATYNIFNK